MLDGSFAMCIFVASVIHLCEEWHISRYKFWAFPDGKQLFKRSWLCLQTVQAPYYIPTPWGKHLVNWPLGSVLISDTMSRKTLLAHILAAPSTRQLNTPCSKTLTISLTFPKYRPKGVDVIKILTPYSHDSWSETSRHKNPHKERWQLRFYARLSQLSKINMPQYWKVINETLYLLSTLPTIILFMSVLLARAEIFPVYWRPLSGGLELLILYNNSNIMILVVIMHSWYTTASVNR